jgi:hypothetical protein
LNVPFYLRWTPEWACDAELVDLFTGGGDFIVIDRREPLPLESDGICLVDGSHKGFDEIFYEKVTGLASYSDFLKEVTRFLRDLRPSPSITKHVREFAREHQIADRVGVHIRHSENINEYKNWARSLPGIFSLAQTSTLDGFVTEIRRLESNGSKFFLCTDNVSVYRDLQSLFPQSLTARTITYDRQESGRNRSTSVESALIDLLLLGGCASILGTFFSSFSKLAALPGGVPYSEIRGRECLPNSWIEHAYDVLGYGT